MNTDTIAMAPMSPSSSTPWYRQRWPWLLMAGPAIVVVAGFVTLWLALRSDDGLVADDYYRRGLLINRQLEKAGRGAAMGAVATVRDDGLVQIRLTGSADAPPANLRVRLAHPTRAGLDRVITVNRAADGLYMGTTEPLGAGRWLLSLETDAWRLPAVEAATPLADVRLGIEAGPR